MKLVIMQPYFFPYIGYFQLLAAADRFVVYDDVNYIQRGWINRNQLLINGQPWLFTVPLDKPSQNRLIKDLRIQPAAEWQPKFLRTIRQNYKHALYFEVTFHLLEQIFFPSSETIADLVRKSLQMLVQYLELPVQIVSSSTMYGNAALRGQARILDICKREEATCYINSIGGRSLYNNEIFKDAGIDLQFLQPELRPYRQLVKGHEFVAGLSIIDVLMNNSPEEIRNLLQCYTLLPAS